MVRQFLEGFRGHYIEVGCMALGLITLTIVTLASTGFAYARAAQTSAADIRAIVASDGFTVARCPDNWAEVHGRLTGLGTDGMVELLKETAMVETPERVRARLLSFKANPAVLNLRSNDAVAEMQIYYCLADAWDLSLM